jgi:hypothetical protein
LPGPSSASGLSVFSLKIRENYAAKLGIERSARTALSALAIKLAVESYLSDSIQRHFRRDAKVPNGNVRGV